MSAIALLLAVLMVQVPSALGYPPSTWTPQTIASTDPTPRSGAPMAFDRLANQMYMFGGSCAFAACPAHMWTWSKTTGWTHVPTTGGPTHCPSAEMVYRSATPSRLVVTCGYDGAPGQVAVWEFNTATTTWSSTAPSTRPSGRQDYVLTYDTLYGRVVLFGGRSNSGPILGDTWTWDGSNWTLASPATSPQPRYGAAFAYDVAQEQTVVVGGQGPGGNTYMDTWAYDGVTWIQRSPVGPMPARWRARGTYDSTHRTVIVHGGVDLTTSTIMNDTWVWDGSSLSPGWVLQAVGPNRYSGSMAYDRRTDHTVYFGGAGFPGGLSNETWVFGLP